MFNPPQEAIERPVNRRVRLCGVKQAEVYATTVVVILTSLVFGLYLFGIDLLLNTAVQRLFQRFGGA